ncbi:NucA/NucB deoxyribonuclease domain-containing protein [Streptomyces violascens]|uniref:NucA/NucB deoxyribonuclease domain-containing protein n=1 Tax=Streptomyces violascens TaxID=67381 RepID=UPI0016789192|nr:hypothetical protein [Streptomyces violascens]
MPAGLTQAAITAGLKAGKSPASLGLVEAGKQPAPTLTAYDARRRARLRAAHASTGGQRPRTQAAPVPFDPTAEPRELTLADCPDPDSGGGPVYEPDRFDVCLVRKMAAIENLIVDGAEVPQGAAFFTDTLIGHAGFGDYASRFLTFEDHVSHVSQKVLGAKWNPAITFFGASKCTAVLGSGTCHSRTDDHLGEFPVWLLAGSDDWKFAVDVPAGGGVGRDDITKLVLDEGFYVVFPEGYVNQGDNFLSLPDLNVRFDQASYVKQGEDSDGAGIFDDLPPALTYNLTGQGTDEVAQHIQSALSNPNATIPAEPPGQTKVLPGYLDNPLHRLYSKYSPPTSETRYNRNGAIARGQCGPRHGKQCDEYPMASTYEGAAKAEYEAYSDPYAYSVKLVDADQNGTAGNIAKQFYAYYRVLDPGFDANNHPRNWDDFTLEIQ